MKKKKDSPKAKKKFLQSSKANKTMQHQTAKSNQNMNVNPPSGCNC